jgi:DHA1 family multidrug resistance protein-like MFS transporter
MSEKRRFAVTPFMWLCLMGGLAIFSSTMSKNPALPLFIKSLNVPERTLGFIAAASTVMGIIVSVPAGILSDAWGRRRVILLSMIVFATAPFLYLLVKQPAQLVLVRMYHGLATAILGPVALAAVADTFQKGRGERMAWYSSATMVGRFLAPSVGGLLIIGQDFRWVYLGCGAAGVLALLAATRISNPRRDVSGADSPARSAATAMLPRRTLGQAWTETHHELQLLLANRSILATSLMDAALYFAFGAVETFLPLYMTRLGFAAREIGPVFTAQVVVTALTKPLMGRLSDRLGRKVFIVAGLILAALVVVLLPWARHWVLLAVLTSLFGLSVAVVTASTSALVSDLSRASAYGASLGVLSSVMDVGQSTGPMVVGLVVGAAGYRLGFAVAAVVLALGAIGFATLVHTGMPATTPA